MSGGVSFCLVLRCAPFVNSLTLVQRRELPRVLSLPSARLRSPGLCVHPPLWYHTPSAHTLELNKKSESPTAKADAASALAEEGTPSFFPPPADIQSKATARLKAKQNLQETLLSCQTNGAPKVLGLVEGEKRGGFSGSEDAATLPTSRIPYPLLGSIMPAKPESPPQARRSWLGKNSESLELAWESAGLQLPCTLGLIRP